MNLWNFKSASLAVAAAAMLSACGGSSEESTSQQAQANAPSDGRVMRLSHTVPSLTPAPSGLLGTVFCANWVIGAVTVDNVDVPAGQTCQLDGTTVSGGVKVGAGSILLAGNGVQIAGSVQGDGSAHVEVSGAASRIAGSLEVVKGGSATIVGIEVLGSVVFAEMTETLSVGGVTARGGMKIEKNTGGATIANNTVIGALQCKDNTPAPAVGGNSADSLEDQCFQAASPPPPTPPSGNVTCVGLTLAGLNLDSIIVPDNATCTVIGSTLNGTLEVGTNSRLIAQDVVITGNLLSDGAAELSITGASQVGGSVQIQRGASATVVGLRATGSMQIDRMAGPVTATGNRISGNLQFNYNRAAGTLSDNIISGVMQCKENLPAPTGSGNTATQKQDQCVGL